MTPSLPENTNEALEELRTIRLILEREYGCMHKWISFVSADGGGLRCNKCGSHLDGGTDE